MSSYQGRVLGSSTYGRVISVHMSNTVHKLIQNTESPICTLQPYLLGAKCSEFIMFFILSCWFSPIGERQKVIFIIINNSFWFPCLVWARCKEANTLPKLEINFYFFFVTIRIYKNISANLKKMLTLCLFSASVTLIKQQFCST